MTTTKIYLEDMYAQSAEAKILAIEDKIIILDQTIFFAEGGGQVGDTGLLGGLRVVDTQKKAGTDTKTLFHPDFPTINVNTINVHILDQAPNGLNVGDSINLELDWERRYKIMKIHSAAHIVLLCTNRHLGKLPIKGCLLQPDKGRIDFGTKITPENVSEINETCNQLISKSMLIENFCLENEPEALFWKCDGIKLPCGGTHVKNTKEIGPIKLKRRSQGKKLDRIYIELDN